MIKSTEIKPEAIVVCSKNEVLAKVDHMEGTDTIKLNKDKNGQHHYIPLSWVTKVDSKVHLDRSCDKATKEWTETSKKADSVGASAKDKATPAAKRNSGQSQHLGM